MNDRVEVSVVVPVGARYDDVHELYQEYKAALESAGRTYDLNYVLDGDVPSVLDQLTTLQNDGEQIQIIKLAKGFGEATALTAGFDNSCGQIILTLPAYYQVEPSQIPKVLYLSA